MWVRSELKDQAKACLKPQYWSAVGISLIVMIIAVAISSVSQLIGVSAQEGASPTVVTLVSIVQIALALFLINPLIVGMNRYFLSMTEREAGFGDVFLVFQVEYLKTVAGMFMMNLFIVLWSLLFIIPGIIKSYSYRMVPFILAHNPEIGWQRALEISKQTTQGEKWNIFVLDLSFILWNILACITAGIGYIFLIPYMQATFTQLYLTLRNKALENQICTEAELPAI